MNPTEIGTDLEEQDGSVVTWTALQSLGFMPEHDFYGCPAMSFDFGSFKLQAVLMKNLQMRDVVSFSGVVSTSRTICMIEYDMPLRVDSVEQCAAWIAWHIQRVLPRREKIIPADHMELLILGMQHQDSLPWERDKAAYRSRPQCYVERAWLRQALKSIKENIQGSDPNLMISIAFDGRVLSFQSAKWIVPMPAIGESWPNQYEIKVCDFYFPSRLMQETIHVSVWKESLSLGNPPYRCLAISSETPLTTNIFDSLQA